MPNYEYSSFSEIEIRFSNLVKQSAYSSPFSLELYKDFLKLKSSNTNATKIFPAGVPTLINGSSDCANCFYGFQIDTYMNGCTHDCIYCWAKAELTPENKWNNPLPVPIDLTVLWETFYTIFETNTEHPLRRVISSRVPLRIGSMSDPFLAMEKKYLVTLETLKLLDYYKYPFLILTRSDLVAEDQYVSLMNPTRVSVQFSIPSLNEQLVKALEPGTPPAEKRLIALQKLTNKNIFSTVRINPLFPNFPDGTYISKVNTSKQIPKFDFFNLDMIDKINSYGCKAILVGFAHMSFKTIDSITPKIGFDLKSLMTTENQKNLKMFKFSDEETRLYYELIQSRCKELKMEFSTCYLGLGESFFWKDQDLWQDKKDCCNIKNHVAGFKTNILDIDNMKRIQIINPEIGLLKRILISFQMKIKQYFIKNLWK